MCWTQFRCLWSDSRKADTRGSRRKGSSEKETIFRRFFLLHSQGLSLTHAQKTIKLQERMSAAGKMCHKSCLCLFDEGATRGGHLHMLSVSHSLFTWRMNSVRNSQGIRQKYFPCTVHSYARTLHIHRCSAKLPFKSWLFQMVNSGTTDFRNEIELV